ncbi:T9SS type A sorting domain-containing protein [Hymenobacter taeanensis]|uniref:T9SS type A sorting domain-containing protein n=1 Tax=Hymenobacter taeanensis TaxID=2735321 RepID=A0A6M6BIV2_9BACT|nr:MULTISPECIES: choice-of-anchor J domain-containing protein [Hymenobacter]QJX47243.1 T9SS type A sorting domain-containing protein [Hymenobacter taeanensis]UOQ79421.1 choice-of-anchor J domain-containing protein [Hymenobacter sp. 5414T-23]
MHAQNLNYLPSGASNVTTTYTDLGSDGTVITTPNTDDANSEVQAIGFTFNYNEQAFDNFVLNTNGYIKLGPTAPVAPYFYDGPQVTTGGPVNNTAETNLLLPFNLDLESAAAATAEYRVVTTGTAPNRVCTIQWKNVSDKATATIGKQLASLSFQVRLYETTNRIEFVYGTATAGPGAEAFKSAAVGIKGSGNSTTQLISATKGSTGAWSTTSFLAGPYTGNAHNIRKSVLPDAGRTYRFTAQKANDASVSAVYSLGKLPIPFGTPHVVRAFLRNLGTNALASVTVTLTVSGANSFTNTKVVALPVGAAGTLSFDGFTPTVAGTNTITVSVADDDDNSNNTATYTQQVNSTTYAVADPTSTAAIGGIGLTANSGANAGTGILAVRYTASSARTVTSVTARIEDTRTIGRTLYATVLDAAGAILGRTDDYVVTAADISTTKTFTFASPVPITSGNFHVGLAQATSPTGTAPFFPLGTQAENPTRTGVFFITGLTGGALTDVSGNNLGRFMLEAVTGPPVTCFAPTAVSVNNQTATSAVVNFTGPANGTGYSIIYGATGFDPNGTTGATTVAAPSSPFTLTGLAPSTTYALYIRANCGTTDQSTLTGPIAFTTLCTPPVVSTFPYTESFGTVASGLSYPCGITVADVNSDNNTWRIPSSVGGNVTMANAMVYSYNSTDATKGANDWFFTPALSLRAGSRYQLTFKYKTDATNFSTAEKLEVKYGAGATPAEQTNLLWKNESITNTTLTTTTGGTGANQVMPITPTADGTVYIGFHAFSAPDQFNLYVDDISINSVVTGLSDALVRAVNVFPNPSAGMFTVEVRGANAKGAMKVEVTNLLGQRVHTATIRDNAENRVDLSGLANGMYTLKVLSGNDYMIRNIVVQK